MTDRQTDRQTDGRTDGQFDYYRASRILMRDPETLARIILVQRLHSIITYGCHSSYTYIDEWSLWNWPGFFLECAAPGYYGKCNVLKIENFQK